MSRGPDSRTLSWRDWRDPEVVVVCGFASGFVPKAPGTSGSLTAVVIWWAVLAPLGVTAQILAIVLTTLVGTWLIGRVQRRHGVTDPGAIVIDEFAGQWIALLLVPVEPLPVLAAFLLFRLFDIWKPWPVGALERSFGGGFGVMVDDLAAGVIALCVLQFTLWGLGGF